MEIFVLCDQRGCEATIVGKFTFADNNRFRDILPMLDTVKQQSLTFNLSRCTYIDSAALGMLLIAKEHAGKNEVRIILKGATGQVLQILQLSCFDQMFEIAA